jgi:hypothetical protein
MRLVDDLYQIELVVRPHYSCKEYFPQRTAGITGFSHIGLRTTDPVRDEAFWTQLMNARVAGSIGPDGMAYEYSSGVRLIRKEEEASYRSRQFPFEPSSFCMWVSRPHIPEFRHKAATDAQAASPVSPTAQGGLRPV